MKKKNNNPSIARIICLIILILLVIGNTYAWMIYSNKVSTGIDARIKSWKIDFEDEDSNEVTSTFDVTINDIYPGMTDFEEALNITNTGEIDGIISFVIVSANILGTEYITEEGRISLGETVEDDDLTSAELVDMLENDLPFSITFVISDDELEVEETETFTVEASWAYESGDDETDTLWGNNAYYFKEDNPTTPSIQISLALKVIQKADI